MLIGFSVLFSCKHEAWDEHYNTAPSSVDAKLWDAIQDSSRFSLFVKYIIDAGLDSVLVKNQGFTLFIPDNELFNEFAAGGKNLYDIMAYHISPTVFISTNIGKVRKLQTLSGKFALLEQNVEGIFYDGIKIKSSSPLFKDGNFYELSKLASPRPNLFEYTAKNSTVINDYIRTKGVKILDLKQSTPLYIDGNGKTVYDSVYTEVNYLDIDYFSTTDLEAIGVKTFIDFKELVNTNSDKLSLVNMPWFELNNEFRDKSATFLLFTQDQYDAALDVVADNLGSEFNDRNDIPLDWQEEVVMPYFLDRGLFSGSLNYSDFFGQRLNLRNDSVKVNWENVDPASRLIASNGVVFNYLNFEIPKALYIDTLRVEGEDLIEPAGDNSTYKWREDIDLVVSDPSVKPAAPTADSEASNGAVLNVRMAGVKGNFSITFKIPKVFPRKYKLRFQSKSFSTAGAGLIGIRFNGKYLEYDETGNVLKPRTKYDYLTTNGKNTYWYSRPIVDQTGDTHSPIDGRRSINYTQWYVSTSNYGDAEVTLIYEGPGISSSGKETQGALVMDYIGLFPVLE